MREKAEDLKELMRALQAWGGNPSAEVTLNGVPVDKCRVCHATAPRGKEISHKHTCKYQRCLARVDAALEVSDEH